jgi:tetratricopeptide (TPR) repeat protein
MFPEAVEAYKRSVELDPRVTKYTMKLTELLNELGRIDESRDAALSTLAKIKNDAELWGRLGWTEIARRDREAAAIAFKHGIEIDPSIKHLHTGLRSVT